MRAKQAIVYEALLSGCQVEIEGQTLAMLEDGSIGTRMFRGPEREEIWVDIDASFKWFYRACETLTKEEVFLIGSQKVLVDIATRR